MQIMKKIIKNLSRLIFGLALAFIFEGCASLKDVETVKNENLYNYQYVIINSTESLTSNIGTTINGVYVSEGKTVNPRDVISGYLMKKGFIILTEVQDDIKSQTMIANYGESGRREVIWGHTTEVTLQFITAGTKKLICSSVAEEIGDTEADAKKSNNKSVECAFC